MGLFSKRARPSEIARTPRLGYGRRLRSDQALPDVQATLTRVLEQHAPARYAEMPVLTPARAPWHGEGAPPDATAHCTYAGGDIYFFTFWMGSSGTEMGLFPLAGTEESLTTPLAGQWKMQDASLASIGRFEPGLLSLQAPLIPADYYSKLCAAGAKPATPGNVEILTTLVSQMMLAKAHQFMSDQDPRGADAFVERNRYAGDPTTPQRILDELGAWNPQVLPYVQDLPWRVAALIQQRGEDGQLASYVWSEMRS